MDSCSVGILKSSNHFKINIYIYISIFLFFLPHNINYKIKNKAIPIKVEKIESMGDSNPLDFLGYSRK